MVVATAAAPTAVSTVAADFADVYARVRPSIGYFVYTNCDDGEMYDGTGFLIAPNLVLTDEHVLHHFQSWSFTLGGQRLAGQVIGMDERQDVALVQLDRPAAQPFLTMQSVAPRVGTRVAAIGYALGLGERDATPTIASGDVSGVNRSTRTPAGVRTGMLQASFNTNHGASGGPVVTPTGAVVGMVDLGIPTPDEGPQNVNLAVGAATAMGLVSEWQAHPVAKRPSC